MSSWANERTEPRNARGALVGAIAEDAADMDDRVPVTLEAFGVIQFGPCRWQARDELSLPARGDRCLVIFDDNDEPWIVAWWPFA